jgi:hypothetical protein
MSQDKDNLRLLSIFHYILGGLVAMFTIILLPFLILCFPLAIVIKEMLETDGIPAPGWLCIAVPFMGLLTVWTCAGLIIANGYSLAKQRRHTFCMVVAALECLLVPFGTVLGVLTLVLLTRHPVKHLFAVVPPPS